MGAYIKPFIRHWRYYIWYLDRYGFRLPFALINYLAWNRFTSESFAGIQIVDMSRRREVDPRFKNDTMEALRLIQLVDLVGSDASSES